MNNYTKFKDLNLSNAYLFAAALADEATCHLILEVLLGHSISKIKVHTEHSVLISSDFRSIRLDVYARDELEVGYNLEMQNEKEGNLAKRSRYHQAELDVVSLRPGEDFSELRPSYIIFICTFDPFGKKLYRYTFEERCLETGMPLGDETRKIFLSTKGENEDQMEPELLHFLRYVEDSSDSYVSEIKDEALVQIHEKVSGLKQSRELEAGYMKFEELLQRREKKGKAEGKAEIYFLIRRMSEDGRTDEIPRLATNEDFYQEMLKTYGTQQSI